MTVYLGENEVGFNTIYGGIIPSGTYNITENGTYDVTNYESAAVNIESSASNQVKFIDYDGTIVESYSRSEFMELDSLPANPTHTGLTAQGWNWTKTQIEAQLTAAPDGDVFVGQMYVTASGDTEIDITLQDERLEPALAIGVNGTVTVDWGDGTAADTITGNSITIQTVVHAYSSAGDYTIKIHVVDGYYVPNDYILKKDDGSTSTTNVVYSNAINKVRYGSGIEEIYGFKNCYSLSSVTVPSSVTNIPSGTFSECRSLSSITIPNGTTNIMASTFNNCYSLLNIAMPSSVTRIRDSAFSNCYTLSSVTIPSGVTSIGNSAFSNCRSLSSITIPSGVTSIGTSAFYGCRSLSSVTIPSGVKSIGNSTFSNCYLLSSVTIPSGVTSIGTSAFNNCYTLSSVTIPSGVTSIGNSTFSNCYTLSSVTIPSGVTSIGNSAFSNCYTLSSVTIPSGVTSIGNSAFSNCSGVAKYHILPTTIPTAVANMFTGLASDCIIYVPSEKLDDYKAASNWSAYTSYMVGE